MKVKDFTYMDVVSGQERYTRICAEIIVILKAF